jgi:hypothetical protein
MRSCVRRHAVSGDTSKVPQAFTNECPSDTPGKKCVQALLAPRSRPQVPTNDMNPRGCGIRYFLSRLHSVLHAPWFSGAADGFGVALGALGTPVVRS